MGMRQVGIAPVRAAKIRVPGPRAYLRPMASQAPYIPRVGVIGSGSWATALTFLFTQHEEAATHPVHWLISWMPLAAGYPSATMSISMRAARTR